MSLYDSEEDNKKRGSSIFVFVLFVDFEAVNESVVSLESCQVEMGPGGSEGTKHTAYIST
jgi:hypothetical protein